MSFKKPIELVLNDLKAKGYDRGEIESGLGYSENYIDQVLAKGGNQKFLNALKRFNEGAIAKSNKETSNIIRNPLIKTIRNHGKEPVKFYDTDFAASNSVIFYEDNVEAPAYTMNIPAFSGCIAFNVFGDSMEALIKSGSIVFGRKLEEWKSFVEFGQIYGVVMKDERRFLKYIRKSKEDPKHCFLLRSENENYDDFEIPKDKIHNLWLIEGWMLKRT